MERKTKSTRKRYLDIVFVLVGERDAEFFGNIAKNLKSQRLNIGFISYNGSANNKIKKIGDFKVFNLCSVNFQNKRELSSIEKDYQIKFDEIINHEKKTFRRNNTYLKNKLTNYISQLEDFFYENEVKFIFQEIGGYIANLSVFHCAKKFNINHIFIEPSFFKGRVHALLNSIEPVQPEINSEVSQKVGDYIQNCIGEKIVSFSKKDTLHYNNPFLKFIKKDNWYALFNKFLNLYIKRNCVEHRFWLQHIKRYLNYSINYLFLSFTKKYKNINSISQAKKIYFPLHVPDDFQLTTRTPELYDQISLIKYICSIKPKSFALVSKEHPAMRGSFPFFDQRDLLRRNDFYLISSSTNNYDLIDTCDAVITINSKSGFEALLLGKNVIALGESFYSNSGLTKNLNLDELKDCLEIEINKKGPEFDKVLHFAQGVYNLSYPMSLYDNSEVNILNSVETVLQILKNENFILNQ